METKKKLPTYTAEFRDRAVRLAKEQRPNYNSNQAVFSTIASKLGCSVDSLRVWYKQAERDAGNIAGITSEEKSHIKSLEREVRELRQANEILKKASAYFAQAELDRPFRKW